MPINEGGNMKKLEYILGATVAVILICCMFITVGNNVEPYTPETEVIKNYKQALESSEKSIVYIWSQNCIHCVDNKDTMATLSQEYNIISIDLVALSNESRVDYEYFLTSNSYLQEEQWGTPTMLIVKDNKVVADLSGKRPIEEYRSFLNENGM